ncbi:hypothetical protein [Flavobacterium taihuense]|uniref:DNA/RNA non-specific endonuclease n=1 Tax=Flavobacterium taihuense TaxID=2857508 RepID=A0ABS6Y099_9FLAO|nr:hypothetical protein [Flavobacterium taihuense]MBW4362348.1 DNA/RNA non-specific endonuclease [Flavobacterium taihuense]
MIEEIKKDRSAFLLEKKGITRKRLKTVKFSNDVKFEDGKIICRGFDCGSYNESTRVIYLSQNEITDHKGLNLITKHPSLPTKAIIIVYNRGNIHEFHTDNVGRIIYQIDKINENLNRINNRDADEQTKAKLFNDEDGYVCTPRKLKDQGGHACPASAGGLKEMINIFPQAYSINNGKKWKGQEIKMIRKYKKQISFEVKTWREYKEGSRRPIKIHRSFDGIKESFDNVNVFPEEVQ